MVGVRVCRHVNLKKYTILYIYFGSTVVICGCMQLIVQKIANPGSVAQPVRFFFIGSGFWRRKKTAPAPAPAYVIFV